MRRQRGSPATRPSWEATSARSGAAGVGHARALEPGLVARLVERGDVRSYPRNVIIHNHGDPDDALGIVLSGRLRVFVGDPRGRRVPLDTRGPGEIVGLMMLDGGRRTASVITDTPVTLCLFDRPRVEELLATERDFADYLMVRLVGRVRALTRSVGSLALLDVEGRVLRLLQELARDEGGTRVVRPRLTQREIARRVGASPAMVSVVFRELVAREEVAVRGGALHLRAPGA